MLKIGEPSREITTEFHTLQQYDGKGFCRVYAADLENGVLLIERIQPGRRLREEPSLEKRLSAFLSAYKGLHREPAMPHIYPTYWDWVTRITAYMSHRNDYPQLGRYMKKAEELCRQIGNQYPKQMLLHGDLHHDNLLLSSTGEYRLIDPKGVIGDPVFDIA